MISYLQLKEKFVENKQRVMFALASLIIFLLGFGTGRGYAVIEPAKPSNANYATKKEKTPASAPKNAPQKQTPANKSAVTKTTPKPGEPCPVKGSSSKIYHVKGGAFYDRTNPKQCFNTEAEAQAAGFRKSSR